jgi:hypothetical protein
MTRFEPSRTTAKASTRIASSVSPADHTAFEFKGLLAQLLIGQSLELRLHRVDSLHSLAVLLEQTIVATAENFGQEVGGHACRTDHQTSTAGRRPKSLRLVGFK